MLTMYIYPENLKAKPTLWLWQFRDIVIGGGTALFGAMCLAWFGTYLFVVLAGLYLFLTIRFEDACIMDFIRYAAVFFLFRQQMFHWRRINER